jgi:two-component system OmpR family response regulator
MSRHIVVVHQSDEMTKYLQTLLLDRGYRVTTLTQGVELINKLPELVMDLLISSYDLLDIDGETLLAEVNKNATSVPVIFVGTIRDENIIANLIKQPKCEFMLQPIVPVELLARIQALLEPEVVLEIDTGCLVIGELELDTKAKRAKRGTKNIILTPTEYRLLEYLMTNAGTVLTREMILNKVWNTSEDVSDRIVDVYIGYLREKIDNGFKKKLIQTSTGFGYTIPTT